MFKPRKGSGFTSFYLSSYLWPLCNCSIFQIFRKGLVELPETEARHAVQVLRKRVGDVLQLVDGKGGWFSGRNCSNSKEETVN